MSIPRTSIALLTFILFSMGFLQFRPSLTAQQTPAASGYQVVLFGTGTPPADPDRSGPATAIVVNGTPYLVDMGAGVKRRAKSAVADRGIHALEPTNLRVVFVTHFQSDHVVGYPDLILTPWVLGRRVPLEVYGPPGIKHMTTHVLEAYRADFETRSQHYEEKLYAVGSFPEGHKVNAHEIKSGVGLQRCECHRYCISDSACHGQLRIPVRDSGSTHRHLRRYKADAGDDRRLQWLRCFDP